MGSLSYYIASRLFDLLRGADGSTRLGRPGKRTAAHHERQQSCHVEGMSRAKAVHNVLDD